MNSKPDAGNDFLGFQSRAGTKLSIRLELSGGIRIYNTLNWIKSCSLTYFFLFISVLLCTLSLINV